MNKIEVLRSDVAIRQILTQATDEGIIQGLSDTDLDNLSMSNLLETSSISNTEIDELTSDTASDEPLIGSRDVNAYSEIQKIPPDVRQVYTNEFVGSVKNNRPLENNHIDPIRGNVIFARPADCLYEEEFDYEDHMHIFNGGTDYILTNTHGAYKRLFLITDAITKNKISNCFVGQDNSDGLSLSFWLRCYADSSDMIYDTGIFTFLGDYEKHYFDTLSKEEDKEYVKFTSSLHLDLSMCVRYEEAFYNTFSKKRNNSYKSTGRSKDVMKGLFRMSKNWCHIIVSFSNDDIDVYVNGHKVDDYYEVKRGKRFGSECNINELVKQCRTSILDFLVDTKTNLYLGATLNRDKISAPLLFDDITFWDESVESEEQAYEMFQEAITINIP